MNDSAKGTGEQVEAFTRMWTEFASNMANAGFAFSPGSPPPEAARQMRDAFFKAAAEYCESFMRSEQFREWMKQSLEGAMAIRRQMNEFLTRARHEAGGVAEEDIDGLMEALHGLESRLAGRMDRLASRVDELARRFDAGDDRAEGRGSGPAEAGHRSARTEGTASTRKSKDARAGKRK